MKGITVEKVVATYIAEVVRPSLGLKPGFKVVGTAGEPGDIIVMVVPPSVQTNHVPGEWIEVACRIVVPFALGEDTHHLKLRVLRAFEDSAGPTPDWSVCDFRG